MPGGGAGHTQGDQDHQGDQDPAGDRGDVRQVVGGQARGSLAWRGRSSVSPGAHPVAGRTRASAALPSRAKARPRRSARSIRQTGSAGPVGRRQEPTGQPEVEQEEDQGRDPAGREQADLGQDACPENALEADALVPDRVGQEVDPDPEQDHHDHDRDRDHAKAEPPEEPARVGPVVGTADHDPGTRRSPSATTAALRSAPPTGASALDDDRPDRRRIRPRRAPRRLRRARPTRPRSPRAPRADRRPSRAWAPGLRANPRWGAPALPSWLLPPRLVGGGARPGTRRTGRALSAESTLCDRNGPLGPVSPGRSAPGCGRTPRAPSAPARPAASPGPGPAPT